MVVVPAEVLPGRLYSGPPIALALQTQETVTRGLAAGLDVALSQERLRSHDRLVVARVCTRTALHFARDLATSPLDEATKVAMRRQVALMVLHMIVKDADEGLLVAGAEPLASLREVAASLGASPRE